MTLVTNIKILISQSSKPSKRKKIVSIFIQENKLSGIHKQELFLMVAGLNVQGIWKKEVNRKTGKMNACLF